VAPNTSDTESKPPVVTANTWASTSMELVVQQAVWLFVMSMLYDMYSYACNQWNRDDIVKIY
jgi:hypothetical protein